MVMDKAELKAAKVNRERLEKEGRPMTFTGSTSKDRHVHTWKFGEGKANCTSPGCDAVVEMTVVETKDKAVLELMAHEATRLWNMRGRYSYNKTQREYAKDHRALLVASRKTNPAEFISLVKRYTGVAVTVAEKK